jgi:membrane glycosyltransferase
MGFLELLTGHDKYRISSASAGDEPIPQDARTALVMPICNEDVTRVFAGLRATYESVAATGDLDRFDFFVLSDSNDPISAWLNSRPGWMCAARPEASGGFSIAVAVAV